MKYKVTSKAGMAWATIVGAGASFLLHKATEVIVAFSQV